MCFFSYSMQNLQKIQIKQLSQVIQRKLFNISLKRGRVSNPYTYIYCANVPSFVTHITEKSFEIDKRRLPYSKWICISPLKWIDISPATFPRRMKLTTFIRMNCHEQYDSFLTICHRVSIFHSVYGRRVSCTDAYCVAETQNR